MHLYFFSHVFVGFYRQNFVVYLEVFFKFGEERFCNHYLVQHFAEKADYRAAAYCRRERAPVYPAKFLERNERHCRARRKTAEVEYGFYDSLFNVIAFTYAFYEKVVDLRVQIRLERQCDGEEREKISEDKEKHSLPRFVAFGRVDSGVEKGDFLKRNEYRAVKKARYKRK